MMLGRRAGLRAALRAPADPALALDPRPPAQQRADMSLWPKGRPRAGSDISTLQHE